MSLQEPERDAAVQRNVPSHQSPCQLLLGSSVVMASFPGTHTRLYTTNTHPAQATYSQLTPDCTQQTHTHTGGDSRRDDPQGSASALCRRMLDHTPSSSQTVASFDPAVSWALALIFAAEFPFGFWHHAGYHFRSNRPSGCKRLLALAWIFSSCMWGTQQVTGPAKTSM